METMTRQQCLDAAERSDREVQRITEQYGTGVRPSWVSCDIGIAQARAARYRQMAEDGRQ